MEQKSTSATANPAVTVKSVATHIDTREIHRDKPKEATLWSKCSKRISINGPFNFAFIYGAWEIIRARKVGTTHTLVDYVFYRLFYVLLLIGLMLFEIVNENNLLAFFCSLEVWTIFVEITYACLFLQNVLGNNIHRENVKHRQKIPEKLIVVDEIEKGGRKFYIYKRLSILPTDTLFNLEKTIYVLYSVVGTGCTTIVVAIIFNAFDFKAFKSLISGLFAFADIIFAPIPMRLLHVVFPIIFVVLYWTFMIIFYVAAGKSLSPNLEFKGNVFYGIQKIGGYLILLIATHILLVGVVSLRDYTISLMDDSRTMKQQQSLRSQKRLARRKLMNFIEDKDGKIVRISLEKHTMADVVAHDEFIKSEKRRSKRRLNFFGEEASSSEEEEVNKQVSGQRISRSTLSTEPKRVPSTGFAKDLISGEPGRPKNDMDELERIKSIRLPTPPKPLLTTDAATETDRAQKRDFGPSRIPILVKTPQELNQTHSQPMSKEVSRRPSPPSPPSPPTPPMVSLVQTMMQVNEEQKKFAQRKAKAKTATKDYERPENRELFPQHYVRLIQASEERRERRKLEEQRKAELMAKLLRNRQQGHDNSIPASRPRPRGKGRRSIEKGRGYIGKERGSAEKEKGPMMKERGSTGKERGSGDKVIGSKVIVLNKSNADGSQDASMNQQDGYKGFHSQLTKKLQTEKKKRQVDSEKGQTEAAKNRLDIHYFDENEVRQNETFRKPNQMFKRSV